MVWYGHCLESHFFGIFEVRIRSPYLVQPLNGQELVLSGHVLRKAKAVVVPLLAKKYVSSVGLKHYYD